MCTIIIKKVKQNLHVAFWGETAIFCGLVKIKMAHKNIHLWLSYSRKCFSNKIKSQL